MMMTVESKGVKEVAVLGIGGSMDQHKLLAETDLPDDRNDRAHNATNMTQMGSTRPSHGLCSLRAVMDGAL